MSRIAISFAGLLLCAPITAQVTVRVSVDSTGAQSNGHGALSSISADGRYVAFESTATNLVAGDTNGFSDIFLRDLLNGTTERVNLGIAGAQANASCFGPSISADGRYVAFESGATNLVLSDTNGAHDVFVRDRQLGTTERVSVATGGAQGSGGFSTSASISADGRYVAFDSLATNLVAGDTNGSSDVFVRDRLGGTTERVSLATGGAQGNGNSDTPSISADGRYVAFDSDATNLAPLDNNLNLDVFVRDRLNATTERVSLTTGGAEGDDQSRGPSISADGRYVAFRSLATNLVPGDTNGTFDDFVRDRQSGTTERVSVATGGAQGDAITHSPRISADGRFVTFHSAATNLVSGDTNGSFDVFVRDRLAGTTERVSVATGGAEATGGPSELPSISADGRYVAFRSGATNLVAGDTNGFNDVFTHDRGAGETEQGSGGLGGTPANGGSFAAAISADDRYVAFESNATNLVAGDTNGSKDVFVLDRDTGTTERASISSGGTEGNGESSNPAISADGRYVAFDSVASNLDVGDTNAVADVFVRDRQLGTTTRVSVGSEGNGPSVKPSISAAGGVIAFESAATNLVAGDTNGALDVFVRDLLASTTSRVSVDSTGAQGNGDSANASISADGRYVAFDSAADNLVAGDSNLTLDVFVRDRQLVSTARVSVDSGGTQGLGASTDPSISSDGRFVAFESVANNLVAGDSNLTMDVFVRDTQLASTARASVDSGGTQGAGSSSDPSISADGRHVAFASMSDDLVSGDTNLTMDVFVRDTQLASTVRASVDSEGTQGLGSSSRPSISADGRHVAFDSDAPNLVTGDTNGLSDAFVRDLGTSSAFEAFCFGDGTVGHCPCGNIGASGRGCQNSAGTGGALLTVTGVASLLADTVQFTSSGETESAFGLVNPRGLSVYFQGSSAIAPTSYGDGLLCAGGDLKRLYTKTSVGGVSMAPQAGDPSITARSALLNAPIPLGATRTYQVYYRDGSTAFCPSPVGNTFNVSNGFLVAWGG